MLSPQENANAYQPTKPVCPYCNAEPCTLMGTSVMMGGIPFIEVLCSQCRKILAVNIIPPPPMQAEQPVMSQPRIIVPQ